MAIRAKQRLMDWWIAHVEGDETIWESGTTEQEAVNRLVNQLQFRITEAAHLLVNTPVDVDKTVMLVPVKEFFALKEEVQRLYGT